MSSTVGPSDRGPDFVGITVKRSPKSTYATDLKKGDLPRKIYPKHWRIENGSIVFAIDEQAGDDPAMFNKFYFETTVYFMGVRDYDITPYQTELWKWVYRAFCRFWYSIPIMSYRYFDEAHGKVTVQFYTKVTSVICEVTEKEFGKDFDTLSKQLARAGIKYDPPHPPHN
jgi:hypothetical protein